MAEMSKRKPKVLTTVRLDEDVLKAVDSVVDAMQSARAPASRSGLVNQTLADRFLGDQNPARGSDE